MIGGKKTFRVCILLEFSRDGKGNCWIAQDSMAWHDVSRISM